MTTDFSLGLPNVFIDEVMPKIKTLGELKITTHLILQTITIGRAEVAITQESFENNLNLSSTTVCKGIQDGLLRGTILRRFEEGIYFYRVKLPGMPIFDMTPYLSSYPGKVYIIKGDKYFKIGKSRDFEARLRLFNLTLPFKVEVFHTIETNDCTTLESYFHKLFAAKRVNGEWFILSPDELNFIKQYKAF